jgi:hypothetical protein
MGRKGWWQQLRDNDFPETNKSYGQDIYALDQRPMKKKPETAQDTKISKPKKSSKGKVPAKEPLPHSRPIIPPPRALVVHIFRCGSCGHEKCMTPESLEDLRKRLTIDAPLLDIAHLKKKLHRLKCANCGAKKPELIAKGPVS